MALEYRVFAEKLEVLRAGAANPSVRVFQESLQVLRSGVTAVATRVGAVSVEVLRSVEIAIPPDPEVPDFQVLLAQEVDQSAAFPIQLTANAGTLVRASARERNPFAAHTTEDRDFLKEQQRILREQHNKTQAGDSTFDSGLLLKTYPNKEFTLGSLGRFYDEDLGIIIARFCQFQDWQVEGWQGQPVGRLLFNSNLVDWICTNDLAKSHRDFIQGFTFFDSAPRDGDYGWVVVSGANPAPIRLNTPDGTQQNEAVTWTGTGSIGTKSSGTVIARRYGVTATQGIPTGGLFIQIEGRSDTDLSAFVLAALEDDIAEIERIAGVVSALQTLTAAQGVSISTLLATDISLLLRIQNESAARNREIQALRNSIVIVDIQGLIDQAKIQLRNQFVEADEIVYARANQAYLLALSVQTQISGIDLSALGQLSSLAGTIVTLDSKFGGIRFDTETTPLVEDQVFVSVKYTNADGNDYFVMEPVDYEFQNLFDVSFGVPTNAQVYAWNTGTSMLNPVTVVYPSRTLTAGYGLTGGGDLSADRTFALDASVVNTLAIAAIQVAPTTTTTATYTMVLGDAGGYRRFTHAAGCAITVPPNSGVAFPIGTTFTGRAVNSAATNWVEGAGVTLNKVGGGTGGQVFAEIGSTSQVKKVGTNEWDIIGAVA